MHQICKKILQFIEGLNDSAAKRYIGIGTGTGTCTVQTRRRFPPGFLSRFSFRTPLPRKFSFRFFSAPTFSSPSIPNSNTQIRSAETPSSSPISPRTRPISTYLPQHFTTLFLSRLTPLSSCAALCFGRFGGDPGGSPWPSAHLRGSAGKPRFVPCGCGGELVGLKACGV